MRGWIVCCAGLLGCGADDAGPALLRNATPDPCAFAPPISALIDLSERTDAFHTAPYARAEAFVRDRPPAVVHAVVAEAGGCRLLKLAYGDCGGACAADALCSVDDRCEPDPRGVSGGTLTVTGTSVDIDEPAVAYSVGTYDARAVPADLFTAQAPIEARLSGADFPGVALVTPGVAPMDPDLTGAGFVLRSGADATFTWTPGPDPGACVEVVLKGRNAVHGAPLADLIECVGPDTGSLVVPRSIVDAFPIGATPEVTNGFDWPHSELSRYARTSVATPAGRAALVVRSTTYFRMSHEGE